MKKVIIRNAWCFEPLDSDYEHPTGESMTIPDESFSISEILAKFSQGLGSELLREGEYSDTDDFDDVDVFGSPDFDISDIPELLKQGEAAAREGVQGKPESDDITASIAENTTEKNEA